MRSSRQSHSFVAGIHSLHGGRVRVDDAEATPAELGQRRRLARSRHAGDQDARHLRTVIAALGSGDA